MRLTEGENCNDENNDDDQNYNEKEDYNNDDDYPPITPFSRSTTLMDEPHSFLSHNKCLK